MKKVTLLLILTIGWYVSNSQFAPIQPYNESGYTQQQFVFFAQGQTPLQSSYRQNVLNLVNSYLKSTGLSANYNNGNPLDESWLTWVFDPSHTYPEQRRYENGFWNTRIENGYTKWFWDKRKFTGSVMVLHIDGFEFDLGKTICTNLVNIAPLFRNFNQSLPALPPVYQKKEEPNFQFKSIPDENPIAPKPIAPIEEKKKEKKNRHIVAKVAGVVGTALLVGVIAKLLKKKNVAGSHRGPAGAPITP